MREPRKKIMKPTRILTEQTAFSQFLVGSNCSPGWISSVKREVKTVVLLEEVHLAGLKLDGVTGSGRSSRTP